MKRLAILGVRFHAAVQEKASPVQRLPQRSFRNRPLYVRDQDVDAELDKKLRTLFLGAFPIEASFLARQRFFRECPPHRWIVFDDARNPIAHLAIFDKTWNAKRGCADRWRGGGVRGAGFSSARIHASFAGRAG